MSHGGLVRHFSPSLQISNGVARETELLPDFDSS